MPKSKYTHLFFDLDNTLWDFTTNSKLALRIALEELQLSEYVGDFGSFFNIYHQVNEHLWDLYRKGEITKKKLSCQRFEESFLKNGTPLSVSGDVVNDTYLRHMPHQTHLVPGARELLDYLYPHYQMAIITNGFKEVQFDKLTRSDLSRYFKKIIISEEVGAQKPNPEIFEHALKSMNAPKRKTLMIGDSWEADILGAQKSGLDQVFLLSDEPEKDLQIVSKSIQGVNGEKYLTPPLINGEYLIKNINIHTTTTIISHLNQIMIFL